MLYTQNEFLLMYLSKISLLQITINYFIQTIN